MRFTKKPEEIEAVRWNGSNWHEVLDLCGHGNVQTDGKDVFLTDDPQRPNRMVINGQWIVRSPKELFLVIASDDAIHRDWEPVAPNVALLR